MIVSRLFAFVFHPKLYHRRSTQVWLLLVLALLTSLLATPTAAAHTADTATLPSLLDVLREQRQLDFCGEPVPLHVQEVRERFEKEMLLMVWNRPQIIPWLKRSARYLSVIDDILNANRMPGDLKYVAVVESALLPHIRSPKGARGFWQFMPATARNYGLRVDRRVDERRNIFHATEAAVRYFKFLYKRFGSWTLSSAAYNMGEQGLSTEMMIQNNKDFYHLHLPLETQRYVLRIVAAKLIINQPERFGFRLRPEDLYPPLSFDRLNFESKREVPLQLLAKSAGTSFKQIKDLNPQLLGHYLAAGSYQLLIPKGSARGFRQRFKQLRAAQSGKRSQRIYIVRKGDTLSQIAENHNVPLPALLIWNRLNPNRSIYPGQRLVVSPKVP